MLASVLLLGAAVALLTRMARPRHRVDFLLMATGIGATLVFLLALLLSSANRLADVGWWVGASLLALACAALPLAANRRLRAVCLRPPVGWRDVRQRIAKARRQPGTTLLMLLGVTLALMAAINLLVGAKPIFMHRLQ